MEPYLNQYFLLLKIFYNLNKLKINDDKTNLILLNNPRHDNEVKDTKITTDTDVIKPKEKFTILGWVINRRLDYSDHLNSVSQKIHHRIHRANEITADMSKETCTTYADLFSVLNYRAPMMRNGNEYVKSKMHVIHMNCFRNVRGNL